MFSNHLVRVLVIGILLSISSFSSAQVEVVNQQLINQYGLDFSDVQAEYSLEVGTDNALYLRHLSSNTLELISKTANGQPATIENSSISNVKFEASTDFEEIAYISKDPGIVSGDTGNNDDVFIYDRSSGQTIRVEGLAPHAGVISQLRISPTGNHVVFLSSGLNFAQTVGAYSFTDSRIYIYDFNQQLLSTVRYEGDSGSSDLSLMRSDGDSFSLDGTKLFFDVSFYDGLAVSGGYYINEIQVNTTRLIGGSLAIETLPSVKAIDNTHYVYYKSSYGGDFFTNFLRISIYNTDTGLTTNPGFETPNRWEHFAGTSANRRYALFYTSRNSRDYLLDYGDDLLLDSTAGDIRVYDTLTGQSMPAFTVNRQALNFVASNFGAGDYCAFVYVLSPVYLDQIAQDFPCTENNPVSDVNDYISRSDDTYNIDPNNLRFHNNNRYITFDANSWYLDESIAHDDFTIPYTRDTFVVVNPFLETINLVGAPVVDRSSESGVFVWRTFDGRTMVKVTAGDAALNGQVTPFKGNIVSGSTISALTPINIESSDNLSQGAMDRIDFDLLANRPWEDRFSFLADATQPLCITLDAYAGGLFLGPDKVEVTPPYDIHGLLGCGSSQIDIVGRPNIDRSAETGVFVWVNESGRTVVKFVAGDSAQGGASTRFAGTVISDQAISSLMLTSIEASDSVNQSQLSQIDFEVFAASPWEDRFSFVSNGSQSVCITLEDYAGGLFIGPDKIKVSTAFDLVTLDACEDRPVIETRGKPNIDRSTDVGIFVWLNVSGQWVSEVVSGDMPRTVDIDVGSNNILTNVQPINIESNDNFIILPKGLDLQLNVNAPWMDGFKFADMESSNTCIETTRTDFPVYIGPNRINLGSGVNLTTLSNCKQIYRADVNGDGMIDAADAGLIQRYTVGLDMAGTGWKFSPITGDSNCDGIVNISDAVLVSRFSEGLDMSVTEWCIR